MAIPPEAFALGAVAIVIIGAGAYSYFTGGSASVDLDDREVTFEGPESVETPSEDPRATDTHGDVEQQADPTPEEVQNKSGLTSVKGIGATRAEALGKAGYPNPEDLYYASDDNLIAVDGIGEYTVEQIREDIGSVDDEGNGSDASTEDES